MYIIRTIEISVNIFTVKNTYEYNKRIEKLFFVILTIITTNLSCTTPISYKVLY